MLKYLLPAFWLLISIPSEAKIEQPIQWSVAIVPIDEQGAIYSLNMTAELKDGWYVYSQNTPPGGPYPTSFKIELNQAYELIEGVLEPQPITVYDDVFEINVAYFKKKVTFKQKIKLLEKIKQIEVTANYMLCTNGSCTPPDTKKLVFDVVQLKPKRNFKKDHLHIFFLAFLSGLIALLTPCMFPMIPLTISFFTKSNEHDDKHKKSRLKAFSNILIYGLSIVFIYTGLGYLVTVLFGADTLNSISTSVAFNLFFFILLIFFALSFLGAFSIELPASWANTLDKQSRKGGLIGIFFMALVLAVVSFSCTGPIIGTLLVEAATRGGLYPIFGMLGFSSALALPFMFFATFPSFLNTLPKSGSWMEIIKISLGFLELALAIKFISNVDLVLQLHLLEREVFIALWVAIFTALALFLFGILKLHEPDRNSKISPLRVFLAIIALSFSIYLTTGLSGANPLKSLSGLLPPINYTSLHIISSEHSATVHNIIEGVTNGPHGINLFEDYDEALAYARQQAKPLLIDFTGYACANCRRMEENLWNQSPILDLMKEEFVIASLHVDDKRSLSQEKQYVSKFTGQKVTTIGKKWSEFQTERYNANTQPYYVIVDTKGNDLQKPMTYTMDKDVFADWLIKGIDKFKQNLN